MIFDQNIFDSAIFDAGVIPNPVVSDGVGGGSALVVYKRPHKKVHDEIEEYFSRLTETEADEVIAEAQAVMQESDPRAREAVADSLHARAVAQVAKLLDEERRAELQALLALAMDEDDAEAVIVMMEVMH